MGRNRTGRYDESGNRKPLWEAGYSTGSPMYTFIRKLAW